MKKIHKTKKTTPKTAAKVMKKKAKAPVRKSPQKKPVKKAAPRAVRKIPQKPALRTIKKKAVQKPKKPAAPENKPYVPSDKEPYMCPRQLEYFKQKLMDWRDDLIRESSMTLQDLKDTSLQEPDMNDRASVETDQSLELRTRDRMRKLIKKINAALGRIEDGSYGYCEETGDPIGLKRLEARPVATLCIEAQERHERKEKIFFDPQDADRK